MSDNEKVGAAREYAEHHGIKPWTEHIFNVLDALEVAEQNLAAAQAVIAEVKRYAEDRDHAIKEIRKELGGDSGYNDILRILRAVAIADRILGPQPHPNRRCSIVPEEAEHG